MKFIQKYQKVVFIAGLVFILLGIFFYWQRQVSLSNATATKLEDEPRTGEKVVSTFYYEQLTIKEAAAYDGMKEKLEEMAGGVITFEEPLSGPEYLRVTTALEDEGYNYFYGFYDIPMTKDDVYVKHKSQDLTTQNDKIIAKVILFLSCAEGLNEEGDYAEDGTVKNLADVQNGLFVNAAQKVEEITKTRQETEEILNQVMADLPADYGEKKTVDYFLAWMEEKLSFASSVGTDAKSFTSMDDVFENVYVYNNLSAVTKDKATVLGYAKILSELCNRAGMESHIVLGVWGKSKSVQEGYVFCAVQMNGQTIYVDASGAKGTELGDQQYLTWQEATNHMKFVEYFEYE